MRNAVRDSPFENSKRSFAMSPAIYARGRREASSGRSMLHAITMPNRIPVSCSFPLWCKYGNRQQLSHLTTLTRSLGATLYEAIFQAARLIIDGQGAFSACDERQNQQILPRQGFRLARRPANKSSSAIAWLLNIYARHTLRRSTPSSLPDEARNLLSTCTGTKRNRKLETQKNCDKSCRHLLITEKLENYDISREASAQN